MINKKYAVMFMLLGVLIVAPISFVFYQALGSMPYSIRMLSAFLVAVIFFLAGLFMCQTIRQMGVAKYWLLCLTLLLGLGLLANFGVDDQSADSAQVYYSDGTKTEGMKPNVVSLWGQLVYGYDMHPAYGAAVVPDSLVANFSSRPKEVSVLFTKPKSALFLEDGKATESDGISVELNAFDVKGNIGYSKRFLISQDEFLKDRWIKTTVKAEEGIASIKVALGWGAEGSTPNYDSTIVGFRVSSWYAYAEVVGKVVLVCVGFFLMLLSLILNFNGFFSSSAVRRQLVFSKLYFYGFLVLICIALVAYWSQFSTSYVYFWDYRNYWSKTELMYELIRSGAWAQIANVFSTTYAADYSMLPTVLPALLSLIVGYPSRITYAFSITVLYAVPAYIMIAYLAKRLIDGNTVAADTYVRGGWVLASLAVFFGLPLYFDVTLYLMPDIGGVALFVGAVLCASSLIDTIVSRNSSTERSLVSKELFRSGISLGVILSVMFVFRRWYVFAAVGIAFSLFFLVLVEILLSRGFRKIIFFRAIASVVLIVFSVLPFLCWVLFAWARDFGQHDYANLYASYKFSSAHDVSVFMRWFGVVVPLLCVGGAGLLCYLGKARRLFFILLISTFVACALFLYVQSPARHHYMLLMPMFGASLAGLAILMARRFGVAASFFFTMFLVLAASLSMSPINKRFGVTLFASFEGWMPKHQKYIDGYVHLAQWLALPENETKKFCLIASSETINQAIFGELWQVVPGITKNAYDQRLIQLGQIDSVNGPPVPLVKQCEIFLVGVPFQAHMQPNQQYTLGIIQEDMVKGTGIGMSVERTPKVFLMGDDIEIYAYRSIRGITNDEYDNLVNRFLGSKDSGHSSLAGGQ